MRSLLVSLLCVVLTLSAPAQQDSTNFSSYNAKREQISRNGMFVLGGWSVDGKLSVPRLLSVFDPHTPLTTEPS